MTQTLLYAGSVKNLYQDADSRHVWFQYTDDYSVFDWGKMPDTITGKGEALARLGEYFFRQLEDPANWKRLGLDTLPEVKPYLPVKHHFLERQADKLKMLRVDVPKLASKAIGGTLVYDYAYPATARQLIPLEVIFRFGVPKGSNLLTRKDWYPFPIHEGAEFDRPLIEFSTKLESKDRMLTYQEAVLILKGSSETLAQVHGRTYAVALFLQRLFKERGLKLWDGKLEWAMVDGNVCLVDSIGPDELRVGQEGAVMSKQFLRDFYLGTPWEQALVKGKDLAKNRATSDWKSIVREELQQKPQPLSKPYLDAATALYQDFCAILVEGKASRKFLEAVGRL